MFPYICSTIGYSELDRLASTTINETHFGWEGSEERYWTQFLFLLKSPFKLGKVHTLSPQSTMWYRQQLWAGYGVQSSLSQLADCSTVRENIIKTKTGTCGSFRNTFSIKHTVNYRLLHISTWHKKNGGAKENTLCNIEIYRLARAQKSKHGYKTPPQSNLSYSLLMILVTLRNWSKLIISNTFFCFFKKIFWDHIFDTHIYIPWSKQTDLTLAILNKSAKMFKK